MRGRRQCDPINGCGKIYKQAETVCPACGLSEAFSLFLPFNPLDWIYDLETYPNVFTASFKHPLTGTRAFFEISERRNDLQDLAWFLNTLRETSCRMIGFNNVGFDYPIIHLIMEYPFKGLGVEHIYQKCESIINTPWERRFDNVIWDNDVLIPQIDLFKIHHFDNENRHTSLKILEFNMKSQNIQDLPYEPGIPLRLDQIPGLCTYNDHDVDETEKFYIESIEMIEFREDLTRRYGKNFLNHSDKKIGTEMFVMELEKNNPGCCYQRGPQGRITQQTPRSIINLGEIIFPYINFERPEFNHVINWLKGFSITKTKGVLEYLEVPAAMAYVMDPSIIKVYGLCAHDVPSMRDVKNIDTVLRKGILLSLCKADLQHRIDLHNFKFVSGWDKQTGLNCIVDGFKFDFGTGGIHGSIDSTIVYTDDTYIIYDWDVAGYYPSLGAVNNLFPEHLSNQFGVVDAMLKAERAKHKKGTPLNKAIKLARNGAYGDSNNKYSPFYDPQYTMSITINGQLLLCLLAEQLLKIPGLTMVQANTDGVTVKCPRGYVDQMKMICKWWEDFTCLELESVIYSRMFIRDVNNYIGEYEDGKLKRKGAYEYDLEWHQNHSQLVVPMAAEAALIRGVDIGEFIRNHNNIFDFMLRTKVGRSDHLIISDDAGNERELQRTTRYYIGVQGGSLTKVSPPVKGMTVGAWKRATKLTDHFYNQVINELGAGNWAHLPQHELDANGLPWDERINTKNRSKYIIRRTGLNVGRLVAPCNDIRDACRSNIDYEYYIAEAHKLVNPLRG